MNSSTHFDTVKVEVVEIVELTEDSNESKSCDICGRQPAGSIYGAIACGSCKIFFIRATTAGAPIPNCQNGGRCQPPYFFTDRAGKSKCIRCRYTRAINAGMDPKRPARRRGCSLREQRAQVGLKPRGRPKRNDLLAIQGSSTANSNGIKEFQLSAVNFAAPIFVGFCDSVKTIRNLVNLDNLINNADLSKSLTLDFDYSLDVSIADVLANPGLLCQRVPLVSDGTGPPQIPSHLVATLGARLVARLAMHTSDWCRGIPEFWDLNERDRLKLFFRTHVQFFSLTSYYKTYKHSFNDGILSAFGTRVNVRDFSDLEELRASYQFHVYFALNTIIPVMKRVEMRDEEFLLIKTILTFSSGHEFSELGQQVARRAFHKYAYILLEIRFKDERLAMGKFHEMMLIPMCMQTVSTRLQAGFNRAILNKQMGIEGRLPEEILINA